MTSFCSKASLGPRGSSSDMSTAPKSTDEVPAGAPDTGIQSAEEMTDSMLRDSPFRDVEEEQQLQQEDIPAGEPIIPPLDFLDIFAIRSTFLLEGFFLRSLESRGSCGGDCGCSTTRCWSIAGGGGEYLCHSFRKHPTASRQDQTCTRKHELCANSSF